MSDTDSQARVLQYTARIVAAQASRNTTTPEGLVALIRTVHSSLLAVLSPDDAHVGGSQSGPAYSGARSRRGDAAQGEQQAQGAYGQGTHGSGGGQGRGGSQGVGRVAENGKLVPAVPIKRSIHRDYLISLEDGAKVKMLKRHLATSYGLTPEQYRAKWGLPPDYPMVAPAYAERRSALAKEIGLGRKRKAAPDAAFVADGVEDDIEDVEPIEAVAEIDEIEIEVADVVIEAGEPDNASAEEAAADVEFEEMPERITRHTAESVFANFRGAADDDDNEPGDDAESAGIKAPEPSKRKRFAQQPARRMPGKRKI